MNAKKTKTVVGNIDPDVLQFTVGKDPILDLKLVKWDCLGSAAHVTMLTKMKYSPRLFSKEDRNNVVVELQEIMKRVADNKFEITEADQDCHLAIERTLTEKLGDVGRRVHTGRSRNDQVATAIRLYIRDELLGTMEENISLAKALIAFGKKYKKLPMVGRTHLQPAMPSSVGVWATCYGEGLLDDMHGLWSAFDFTNRNPLGSAASYGVPLPTDRPLTAKLLGFAEPIHNVMYAGNSRGKTEYVAVTALSNIMLTLSRLAEDLIIFSMPEFGYFKLPKEFCTGSSIMPQKYNPDVCELIRGKASRVMGLVTSIAATVKAMAGGYNRDLQDTKELVMEAFETTRAALRIMSRLVSGITPDPDRLRAAFEPGVFATDRALELVASGMPFRDAYHQVRDNLEALKGMDPDEVIAQKTHTGATNGLDFDMYEQWVKEQGLAITEERKHINKAFADLLKPLK